VGLAAGLVVLGACASARAQGTAGAGAAAPPSPPNYAAGFLGTTVAYRPNAGEFSGWQHDLTAVLGVGRFVRPTLALELDLGPTWVRGDYASFALVPGLVWTFHPNAYAAARLIIPIDPETNLVLFPGLGLCYALGSGLIPILEVNLSSAVGRGEPDLGVAVTIGLLVPF
jgi:hypothetical protein